MLDTWTLTVVRLTVEQFPLSNEQWCKSYFHAQRVKNQNLTILINNNTHIPYSGYQNCQKICITIATQLLTTPLWNGSIGLLTHVHIVAHTYMFNLLHPLSDVVKSPLICDVIHQHISLGGVGLRKLFLNAYLPGVLLGRAWASPTLAWLHCIRMCLSIYGPTTYRKF